ncbi:MAG: thiol-disulfide oxidoreductase DCC family protein [Vulcanimicrobiaceae bacterium]
MSATVLYDGDCGFCRASVGLVAALDRAHRIRAVPFASQEGRTLLLRASRSPEDHPESVVALDGQGAAFGSDAVVRIARELGLPWMLLGRLGEPIPRALRERAYRWVAGCRRFVKLP